MESMLLPMLPAAGRGTAAATPERQASTVAASLWRCVCPSRRVYLHLCAGLPDLGQRVSHPSRPSKGKSACIVGFQRWCDAGCPELCLQAPCPPWSWWLRHLVA